MDIADFLRRYTIRSPNIMWFLGAGASAAAGIPTAYHMIWDFKRMLYCSAQHVPIEACSDLGSLVLRAKLQQYFDSIGGYPGEDSEDEYAYYFEQTFPDEADRRRYIDDLVSVGSPSYGHLALAALFKLDKARVVWTTNFDSMVEDSAASLLGSSGKLVTATLDAPLLAMQALNEGRWPLLVKLHGDFRSRRLKNTADEIRKQDVELRRSLTESCRRYGLAVAGYSGRDNSIMDALEEALDDGGGYPHGLFWFHRSGAPPLLRVSELLTKATDSGVDVHLVEVETFDELLADILLLQNVPPEVAELLNKHSRRVSNAPLPNRSKKWPVLRLNALPITSAPTVCRRVVCKVGGIKEVREIVTESKAQIIATRRQVGVLAFGSDAEVRKAFRSYNITQFDIHAIESRRLRYESAELSLLYEALSRALTRERPVIVERRGPYYLVAVDPEKQGEQAFQSLRRATKKLSGIVPNTKLRWAEAIRVRLDFKLEQLWLVLEPTILVERTSDEVASAVAKEFVRNRLAARYNKTYNDVVSAWAELITAQEQESNLRAFGSSDGIDATFEISRTTAFSGRERA